MGTPQPKSTMGCFVSALKVAGDLKGVVGRLGMSGPELRQSVAEYCEGVSKTLIEIHEALRDRRTPDQALGKLAAYALRLPAVFSGLIGESEAEHLGKLLVLHWPRGDLLELIKDEAMRKKFAKLYAEASASFKDLADAVWGKRFNR